MSKKNKKNIKLSGHEFWNQSLMIPALSALSALLVLCLFAFFPTFSNQLVDWDDLKYITENPLVRDLSAKGLKQIFSTVHMGNYHPLTILSLAIDYKIAGEKPLIYHSVNFIYHLFNSFLVFLFVRRLGWGAVAAYISAALFAAHPLHVESVVWAAERKDVMYTFFFLGSLLFYVEYVHSGAKKWLIWSLVAFMFSCLSKGMAVTLPLILLAIDYLMKRKISIQLVLEKIPHFIIALIFGIVAVKAQKIQGGIVEYPEFGAFDRVLLACYGYVFYIWKMSVPTGLSAVYPYPSKEDGMLPAGVMISLPLLILLLGIMTYAFRKSRPVFFGLAFFTVAILPVLQLLPVGDSITADRYFYVSSIGLFFIIGVGVQYSIEYLKNHSSLYKSIPLIFAGCIILIFTYLSNKQSAVWQDDLSLFTHAMNVQPNSHIAQNKVGVVHHRAGRIDEAMKYYQKGIELFPRNYIALSNLGLCLTDKQEYEKAISYLKKSIEVKDDYADSWYNLGNASYYAGNPTEAIRCFTKTIKLKPAYYNAYNNRGATYMMQGEREKAIADFRVAARGGNQNAALYLKQLEGK